MPKTLHPLAGAIALVLIATFWIATVLSETLGATETVVIVKTTIPWGLLLLVPALALAGRSGFSLARHRPCGLSAVKRKRMPVIAANGLLVLVPASLFLAVKAHAGQFDMAFYTVQAVELVAGAVNIALLGMNMRDGLRMSGRVA